MIKSPMISEVEMIYKSKQKPCDRQKINSSDDANRILHSVWSDKVDYVEEFAILILNRANHVIGWIKISQGGTAGTIVDAKLIFQAALLANASGIILAHNHPSGRVKPSDQDITQTKKLKKAGEVLDIKVLDHIIISSDETSYFSFIDNGLL
jgi:DNA repair protein RadC